MSTSCDLMIPRDRIYTPFIRVCGTAKTESVRGILFLGIKPLNMPQRPRPITKCSSYVYSRLEVSWFNVSLVTQHASPALHRVTMADRKHANPCPRSLMSLKSFQSLSCAHSRNAARKRGKVSNKM